MQLRYFMHQRQEAAPPTPEALALPQLPEQQPIDPHEFVMSQEKSLKESAVLWQGIAERSLKHEGDYVESIGRGIEDAWRHFVPGAPLPSADLMARQVDTTVQEFTTYSLQVARYFSSIPAENIKAALARNQQASLFLSSLPSVSAAHFFNSPAFPRKAFNFRYGLQLADMDAADGKMRSTLDAFTATYASQPEELEAVTDLYNAGIDNIDPRYRELREMIATDWHHPVSEQSKLRSFCQKLLQAPDVFLSSFARRVAEAESNQQFLAVQTMARFAIVARGGTDPITSEHIQRQLAATYERWEEFGNLDTLFSRHVTDKVAEITTYFDAIAGPRPNLKNIRTYPSFEQIEHLRENLSIRIATNRALRRRGERQQAKSRISNLPNREDIAKIIDQAKAEREPPPLKILKDSTELPVILDTTVEAFIEQLKLPKGSPLTGELEKALDYLQKNPIGNASKILSHHTITMENGKTMRLRRLAVEKVPRVSRNRSGYYRIVYTFGKDGILLVDALDHGAFDNKYMS